MTHFHAVVWLDHREAKIFPFNKDDFETIHVLPDRPTRHLHHKAGAIGSGHAKVDTGFLADIVTALHGSGEILVVGPGSAKTELLKYAQSHAPETAKRILGVESADHPTDRQIVAHARAYFDRADRMTAQH